MGVVRNFSISTIMICYSVVLSLYVMLPCATSAILVNAAKTYVSLLSYDVVPVCYVWFVMRVVHACILIESLRFPHHIGWGISGVYCREIAILL